MSKKISMVALIALVILASGCAGMHERQLTRALKKVEKNFSEIDLDGDKSLSRQEIKLGQR